MMFMEITVCPPPAETLADVMTLDNPVNGSSPAIRTDYTGHKSKGETILHSAGTRPFDPTGLCSCEGGR